MAMYKDFHKDIIVRSKANLDNYKGDYEVTMLLNTLYMTLLHPIELRNKLHLKSKPLLKYLTENKIINTCDNEFNPDGIIRNLRNGLAHLNIEVEESNEQIETILIYTKKYRGKRTCPKCNSEIDTSQQFNVCNGYDDYICIFTFSVDELKNFTHFVIDSVLKSLDTKEN